MESTKGELTGERPLLLELQMISREAEEQAGRQSRTRLFSERGRTKRARKNYLVERRRSKSGTIAEAVTTLKRSLLRRRFGYRRQPLDFSGPRVFDGYVIHFERSAKRLVQGQACIAEVDQRGNLGRLRCG